MSLILAYARIKDMRVLNENKIIKEFLLNNNKALLSQTILAVIAISVVPFVAMSAVALGNGVQILSMFNKRGYSKRQIYKSINNLHCHRMIEFVESKGGVTTVRITKKGESRLRSFSLELLEINKPKKWDGKWRMVMFDLPVRYSKVRDALRFQLKKLGFVQFQKSVWVYPYPCLDEILYVSDYYKVGKYVEVMTVEEVNNDKKLRKVFNL